MKMPFLRTILLWAYGRHGIRAGIALALLGAAGWFALVERAMPPMAVGVWAGTMIAVMLSVPAHGDDDDEKSD